MASTGNRDSIRSDYPDMTIPRRNTGYALDDLLYSELFTPGSGRMINLARLITGSEGTLAIVTEAKLGLVPLPPPVKALSCVHLRHPKRRIRANLIALRHSPWAAGTDGQQHNQPLQLSRVRSGTGSLSKEIPVHF
ncbi:MAG: hypothetical protein R2758_13990 [Bacteroidales bacterium]